MQKTQCDITQGSGYSMVHLENFSQLEDYPFHHEATGIKTDAKLFLSKILSCTGCIISATSLAPHTSMPFHHKHQRNEELYLFTRGQGEFQIDEAIFPIAEGTAIRVAPQAVRCWRNISDEPLCYFVIQAPEGVFDGEQTIEDGLLVPKAVEWT
ncbi:cupin domain-containing protein [Thaumasiovibrio subtropicus]|uniref:cupin domain-containing protein n=1 Tax=Thaumasiovibrio subtropicus TaxID=1891207 RepID=UPI000B355DD8|nr:cupin domain-containing protein [Thaumasiovibrio subtropicus]